VALSLRSFTTGLLAWLAIVALPSVVAADDLARSQAEWQRCGNDLTLIPRETAQCLNKVNERLDILVQSAVRDAIAAEPRADRKAAPNF
jgi:hypothetical protein